MHKTFFLLSSVLSLVSKNNGQPVNIKHFTFHKHPVYEPPHEIVREANKRPGISSLTKLKTSLSSKTQSTTKGRPARIKLSKVLPRPSTVPVLKIGRDRPLHTNIKINNSKTQTNNIGSQASPSVLSLTGGTTVAPVIRNPVLGKRPRIKNCPLIGHPLPKKKKRLSPEWRPDNEAVAVHSSDSDGEAIQSVVNDGKPVETEEEEYRRIMGTPSKLISSIVNPKPANVRPIALPLPPLARAPNVRKPVVHMVKKGATKEEILSQLG